MCTIKLHRGTAQAIWLIMQTESHQFWWPRCMQLKLLMASSPFLQLSVDAYSAGYATPYLQRHVRLATLLLAPAACKGRGCLPPVALYGSRMPVSQTKHVLAQSADCASTSALPSRKLSVAALPVRMQVLNDKKHQMHDRGPGAAASGV